MTLQSTESENNNIGNEFPTQFGRRCYVHLPPHRRQKVDANGQLIVHNSFGSWSQIVRVACLRSSSILPFLDGRSPILFATIDVDLNEADDTSVKNSSSSKRKRSKSNNKKSQNFKGYLFFLYIFLVKLIFYIIIESNSQEDAERRNILISHQKLVGNAKALVALRPNPSYGISRELANGKQQSDINYTCAIYDHKSIFLHLIYIILKIS